MAYQSFLQSQRIHFLGLQSKETTRWLQEALYSLKQHIDANQAQTNDSLHRAIFEFTSAQTQLEAQRRLMSSRRVDQEKGHKTVETDQKSD
jgi:hypothetical protein